MDKRLHSSNWYRVAQLRPRLKAQADIHRQTFRGQIWYVLQDQASGQYHRFSPNANYVIGLMDGQRTVQAIWDAATQRLGEDHPTQDEVIELLGQLHQADLLQSETRPNTAELSERHGRKKRQKWLKTLSSPLGLRFRLFDPDPFLRSTLHWVRPLFGWAGFVLWLLIVATGATYAAAHWI